jgi:nicotinate-nucleotide adenylyltransferase
MKIGIFGGTYNPVHLGHTALANYICNLGLVDEVWLMVSPQNPFKQDHQLLDEAVRYRLVTLAVRDFPRLRASDFEFRLPRPSYTYVTLHELALAYPDDTFSLIIGADNWAKFPAWRNSADILAHYPVIVYPREMVSGERLMISDGDSDGDATNANPIFLPSAPLYPISSTAIRCALAAGDDVSPWLDPAVHDEIIRQGLYRQ